MIGRGAPERDRIRLVRMIIGGTQAELAAQLRGVDRSNGKPVVISHKTWSGYERGNPVPRQTVWMLREKFDLPTDWVWFGDEASLSPEWRKKLKAAQHLQRAALKQGKTLA